MLLRDARRGFSPADVSDSWKQVCFGTLGASTRKEQGPVYTTGLVMGSMYVNASLSRRVRTNV